MNKKEMTEEEKIRWLCQRKDEIRETREAIRRLERLAWLWLQRIQHTTTAQQLIDKLIDHLRPE